MSSERPAKRARSAVACRRCKHRKQRCDNQFPTCSNCVSAGETCSYESKVHPPEYVESLELRVADLERSLQTQRQQQRHSIGLQVTTPASAGDIEQSGVRDGADKAGFDMLSAPSFLGTSSGYPLAQAVQAVIGSPSYQRPVDESRASHVKAAYPDERLGRQLLDVYFSKVHPKHPFLSPRRMYRLHETQDTPRGPRASQMLSDRLNSFILCMLYTIGARYHQLAQNELPCVPEAYYAAAMENIECLFQSSSLESLEGMLLLVIFQLRSSLPSEIWSLLGMTMRHAISLGLHRKFVGLSVVDQRRKRLFWTTYMLERSIARTMGRPVSISDRDIDVELPAAVDEDIDEESEMIVALQSPLGPTTMSAVVHIFRLAQIESKIYAGVHRVDRPVLSIADNKIDRLRNRLEQWQEEISLHVPDFRQDQDGALVHYYATSTYHVLHYHLALLLLLLPRLTALPSTHPEFNTCITSAGKVCQLYKRLHDRQSVLAYSIIALHATFVAGLTLIYCFIADPSIHTIQFSSDIRACSTVLYVVSERWPAARKVRDAFERMLSCTVESVGAAQQPTVPSSDGQYDALWSEIAAQFSCDNVLDRDDIWNALGPWFDLNSPNLSHPLDPHAMAGDS